MQELKTAAGASEAAAIAELIQTPRVETISGIPHLLLPTGAGEWKHHNLAALLDKPARKTGNVKLVELQSFIEYLKRHGSLASCNVYLNVDYAKNQVKAIAIFNDHKDGAAAEAGWRDFRAVFEPQFSEEWKRWTAKDRKPLTQIELAHFLEENCGDVWQQDGSRHPNGGEVLAFVTKLEEVRKVKYGNGVNLQNGLVQIEFTEDNDSATKGKLETFREFGLRLAPFLNGTPYPLTAFLRYRIDRNTGEIGFWYELQRADKVLEAACAASIEAIRSQGGAFVVFGTPE